MTTFGEPLPWDESNATTAKRFMESLRHSFREVPCCGRFPDRATSSMTCFYAARSGDRPQLWFSIAEDQTSNEPAITRRGPSCCEADGGNVVQSGELRL